VIATADIGKWVARLCWPRSLRRKRQAPWSLHCADHLRAGGRLDHPERPGAGQVPEPGRL